MPQSACICELTPELDTEASFWLLMHHNEQYKPTNTGRLLLSAIKGGGRTIWQRKEPDFRLLHLLARKDRYPILVFPEPLAVNNSVASPAETAAQSRHGRKPVFLLLDATWQQARKMYNHSPYLYNLPVLGINPERPSRYQLRRSQKESHLCTAEVGAECLAWLGENSAANVMHDYFDVFNERYQAARNNQIITESDAMVRLRQYRAECGQF
ncbi:DTW domain-containing protein [Sansalvadorimonas sp. 2012CJ34-2]|uniref:tRNA-uridine aminocarboxypropyltransferase n=2 Tax=Parendozoicomonas callyspongiae TaxID=2942213 RepID=A0ABT0PI84_9GAMM|nr:DTW domain-containing protein [Sansalvadorimonas sp. 2012CJ34-2]